MSHDDTLQTQRIRGIDVWKPQCIRQYNLAMGGMDLKAQVVQPHVLERKWAKKCTVMFVKDAAVHTVFVTCSNRNETHHLTCTLDPTFAIILIHRPRVASPFGHGRSSIENPPDRLLGRNFSRKKSSYWKKSRNPRMVGSWFIKKEKESWFIGVLTAKQTCAQRAVLKCFIFKLITPFTLKAEGII